MIEVPDALLSQETHEELQADEGEHAEAEDGQDHHVGQLPHRLDQSAHNGLQTWMEQETQKKKRRPVLIFMQCGKF